MAAGEHRHAGLRWFDRGPPDRRIRRSRRAPAARGSEGQVRRRRQATADPGALDAPVRSRRADPLVGWFGFNPGSLGALDGRFPESSLVTQLACASGVIAAASPDSPRRRSTSAWSGTARCGPGRDHRHPATSSTGPAVHRCDRGAIVVESSSAIDKLIDDPVGALSARHRRYLGHAVMRHLHGAAARRVQRRSG